MLYNIMNCHSFGTVHVKYHLSSHDFVTIDVHAVSLHCAAWVCDPLGPSVSVAVVPVKG